MIRKRVIVEHYFSQIALLGWKLSMVEQREDYYVYGGKKNVWTISDTGWTCSTP